MPTRKYSSRSQQTTLTAALTSSATSVVVVSGSALLGGTTVSAGETFTVVIDPDTALEEIVDVTAVSTNTLTVVRGIDGSSGQAHSAGAAVRHMAVGRDYREANTHIEATTGHGATGAVVGTTNTQTLTNKTLTAPVITTPTITSLTLGDGNLVFEGATADAFETTLTVADPTADRTVTIPDATTTLVGTDTTQTLTNKTLTSPTITGTGAIAGTFTGNLTGNVTGSSGSTTGNAATATALATARTFQLTGDVEASGVTFDGTGNVSLTTVIGTGAIVNADVNSSAQIAYSKLNLTNSIVNADINASAAIAATKIAGTAITQADTGTVTSTMIANGAIVDADVNASAAIARTKIANPTADVSNAGFKITNLGTPTSGTDAATKDYADLMIPLTQKGAANGVASLGSDGKLTSSQIPDVTITDTFVVVSQAAMLALTAQTGDVAVRTDLNKTFILTATPASTLGNWQELLTPTDSVLSVDGLTGAVSLSSTYATVANAANKLPLAGGTMSGNIAMGTNKITGLGDPTSAQDAATKNYIDTAVLAPSNLTGPITSVGNVTSIASQTGTGSKFVVDNTPTLITPVLGVATATSINGTTIPTSKTLVATDSTQYVVPSQTGNSGKYLTTDGTTSSWGTIQAGSQVKIEGGTAVTYDFIDFLGMGTNTGTAGTIKVQPLTPTGASTGKRIFTGTTTPSSPTSGDVWVDATASAGADLTVMTIMGAY
jgi:hypothetical protein